MQQAHQRRRANQAPLQGLFSLARRQGEQAHLYWLAEDSARYKYGAYFCSLFVFSPVSLTVDLSVFLSARPSDFLAIWLTNCVHLTDSQYIWHNACREINSLM